MNQTTEHKTAGLICGISAYLFWGFIALYFHYLTTHGVDSMLLLMHRVVWSMIFCTVLVIIFKRTSEMRLVLLNRKLLLGLSISSIMIAINWLAFIYSVETNQLNQSALGYFINPLVSILLGLIVLGERLRKLQWFSVILAAMGVGTIVIARGQLPWIGLSVAISFGFYGLLRKMIPVTPIVGLTIETIILTPLAIIYLLFLTNVSAMSLPGTVYFFLALSGMITAIPLLLFAFAARNLKLSTLGFLQYIAPTCQLLMAVFVGKEVLSRLEIIGFIPIWLALLVFSIEAAIYYRKGNPIPVDLVQIPE